MDTLRLIHLTFSLIGLTLGAGMVAARKGTRLLQALGHLYFAGIVRMNATHLGLYRLMGQFNACHCAALASLVNLLAGLTPALQPDYAPRLAAVGVASRCIAPGMLPSIQKSRSLLAF